MYAIVDISGQQFKVEKDQKVFVHRIEGKEGSIVDFNKVLLIDNDSKVVVGTPVISGAMVSAKIIEHLKGDKVIVFKKKRRKGYRVKNGHRQFFTQVQIESIVETGAKPKAVVVETKKAVAAEKPAEKVEKTSAVKKETTAASTKPAAAKKPVASKAKTETAAKKPAAKKTAATAAKPAAKKTTAKPAAKKATTAANKKPAAKKASPKKAE
jgi:large subunit ribosomal protein L21